ncbi:hypothetical protein PGT21_022131 [Puccinia graminis f. sp. tritici]|nr:hypothetical protein PGT21_022131 [Puccinia graminis f. sp. tritici]KAA1112432.1 hypothetical protein PGTUg99_004998 [Puccinia graminis f. sp. tritici]
MMDCIGWTPLLRRGWALAQPCQLIQSSYKSVLQLTTQHKQPPKMSFSILEDVRGTHQELDRLTSYLTSLLLPGPPRGSHREKLVQAHRAKYLSDLITLRAGNLLESYADRDQERALEIEKLSQTNAGDLNEFYSRLGSLNEFHRKYPNHHLNSDLSATFDWSGLEGEVIDGRDFIDRMFTGEELLGRYLDLHILHDTYNNLTSTSNLASKRLPYISYIDTFDQFNNIPRTTKSRPEYITYLKDLRDYLESFHRRTHPLYDLDADLNNLYEEFEEKWASGELSGWTYEEAETSEGIWCEACTKLYSKQTVYDAHLKSKRHLKAIEKLKGGTGSGETSSGEAPSAQNLKELRRAKDRPIAFLEQEIGLLGKLLESFRVDTKANVERRAALTDKERQQEIEEYEEREAKERLEAERQAELAAHGDGTGGAAGGETAGDDEEDDEARIYNPLKLPLGWDGKPIPYWLYKLHGLGVEYKCEICSDFVYMGRKNFERHFQESRHAFGMRALGLPNTKHFHEITRIEDAFALAEKLKSEGRAEIFRDETMEELEDDEGNVYNRKTYEDLQRQGLL